MDPADERWAGSLLASSSRGPLTGEVTCACDGDTIAVSRVPIRLNGLAAPERDEPGGWEASRAMEDLVLGREVRCELDGEPTHDRCTAICYVEALGIA